MNTNAELIADLQSNIVGDPFPLMRKAADAIEALEAQNSANMATCKGIIQGLEAEVERLTLERDVNKRMRDQHFAEVERLKALSVTNIMLDVVPGDGSGFEVYAKSVGDVVNKLTEFGSKAEDVQGDNVTLRAQLAAAQAQEPVGFVESAVRGAGGFHACFSSGVFIPAGTQLFAAPIPQQAQELSDFATIAGLEASVSHLSSIVDEQLRLLIDVEKECGTDGHGGEFEDGESFIIDRVRAHIACYVAIQPKDMK